MPVFYAMRNHRPWAVCFCCKTTHQASDLKASSYVTSLGLAGGTGTHANNVHPLSDSIMSNLVFKSCRVVDRVVCTHWQTPRHDRACWWWVSSCTLFWKLWGVSPQGRGCQTKSFRNHEKKWRKQTKARHLTWWGLDIMMSYFYIWKYIPTPS